MRRIDKSKPGPNGLLQLRRQGKHYEDLDRGPENAKLEKQVRQALLADQKFLCCYCMRAIRPEKHYVRIEHHQSQSEHGDLDLEWENLLAACSGAPKLRGRAKDDAAARKIPPDLQTCDNRKGNRTLAINPLTRSVDAIRYLPDGRISHPDERLREDIHERLNLNVSFLVEERLEARRRLIERLRRELGPDKTWTATALQRYLDGLRDKPRFDPFMGLLETLLARWISKRSRQPPPPQRQPR